MTAEELATELLEVVRVRVTTFGDGSKISQDVLILGLAEMLGDMLSTTSIEAQATLLPKALRMIASRLPDVHMEMEHDDD